MGDPSSFAAASSGYSSNTGPLGASSVENAKIEHGSLLSGIARMTERKSERKGHVDGARRLHLLGVFANQADSDRCQTPVFEDACENTDRVRAERSSRCEQHDIDALA